MSTRIIRKHNRSPSEIEVNLEDIIIIWLNKNIDDSLDNLQTQSLLDDISNNVFFYTDVELCINYIRIIIEEKVFIIVSDTLSELILHRIHSSPVITSIFIFCSDSKNSISKLDQYCKITGIFNDLQLLFQSVQKTIHFLSKQTLAFNLFDHQKQKSTRDISKDSALFTWFQSLIDILKQIPQSDQAKQDMLNKCKEYYALNKTEMKKIDQFEKTYTKDKAIEWYTRDSFIYRLVNKALRTEDVELLYLFRFYIIDLCSQLEYEWKHQYNEKNQILTLYRGQKISIEEFDKLNTRIGSLISTNGFFSTTKDIQVALVFMTSYLDEQKQILFEIKADYRLRTIVFADISNYSHIEDEKEVLFGLGSVFRIDNIEFDSNLSCWKIQMTATDEGLINIQDYLNAKRQQIDDFSPTVLFGRLLFLELGQIDKAEKYFRMLLKSLSPNHEDFATVCNNLGNALYGKHQLNLAFHCFIKAYILRQQTLHSQHPQMASSLFNIGCVLHQKGYHIKAFACLEKALHILNVNYNGDRLMKAMVINGIGLLYRDKKDYQTSLKYFHQALDMYRRLLPQEYPDIASCQSNIGLVYEDLLEYDQALVYYRRAFEMDKKILHYTHPNIINDFNRIIDIYKKKNKNDNALEFCNKILIEQENNEPLNNPLVAHIFKNMGDIVQNISQSIEYYRKALSIFEQSLNPTDFIIICCLIDISHLYWKYGMFDDALDYQLKVLDKQKKILPMEHSEIILSLENIGRIYYNMQKWQYAVTYFQKALDMSELNTTNNHHSIEEIRSLIDLSERQKKNYEQEQNSAAIHLVINVNNSNPEITVREDIRSITEQINSTTNRKKQCNIQ